MNIKQLFPFIKGSAWPRPGIELNTKILLSFPHFPYRKFHQYNHTFRFKVLKFTYLESVMLYVSGGVRENYLVHISLNRETTEIYNKLN